MKKHENWTSPEWKTLLDFILKNRSPNAAHSAAHSADVCKMAISLVVFQPPQFFGLNYPRAYECARRAWEDIYAAGSGTYGDVEELARAYYTEEVSRLVKQTLTRKILNRQHQQIED